MITKTLKVGFFIFAFASFSFVGAQENTEVTKDKSERMFKHLDANDDGKITLEEFKTKTMKDISKEAQVKARYETMDVDANGLVE